MMCKERKLCFSPSFFNNKNIDSNQFPLFQLPQTLHRDDVKPQLTQHNLDLFQKEPHHLREGCGREPYIFFPINTKIGLRFLFLFQTEEQGVALREKQRVP